MSEPKAESTKKKNAPVEAEAAEPLETIREGSVAASIWQRQSLSGYAYYDFSLSRNWKSMSTDKTGSSKNFFSKNQDELKRVIEKACKWIEDRERQAAVESNGHAEAGSSSFA